LQGKILRQLTQKIPARRIRKSQKFVRLGSWFLGLEEAGRLR
jgi:hypothetical protein